MAEDRAAIVRRESRSLNPRLLLSSLKRIREDREVATMLVAKGAREKCFYFTVGAIRMISVGPGEGLRLERLLLSRGLISEPDLVRAEERRRTMEVPLKEADAKGLADQVNGEVPIFYSFIFDIRHVFPRFRHLIFLNKMP